MISGRGDGVEDLLVGDGIRHRDLGGFKGQVDARLDSVEFSQFPPHPRNTRSAGHPLDVQFNDARIGHGVGVHTQASLATTR